MEVVLFPMKGCSQGHKIQDFEHNFQILRAESELLENGFAGFLLHSIPHWIVLAGLESGDTRDKEENFA